MLLNMQEKEKVINHLMKFTLVLAQVSPRFFELLKSNAGAGLVAELSALAIPVL
jgi:hypothetical protein